MTPNLPKGDSDSQDDGAIVQFVHLIIKEALKRGASDIHLEPMEKSFRIRFRVDGVLQETESPPKRLQPAIISRIKLMSQMNIAERRLPQDGRIQLDLQDRLLDFRVSSIPSAHGETIVMRVLEKESLQLGLGELGFWEYDQEQIEKLISNPDGIVLVTGPTGSGKSTTLYSCLNYLNKPDRKIITVEDPVEYQISGINQAQARSEIGMTFSAGLRAMLRQAPYIIMVGEIRDLEAVEIAINASLTGHLVFSTLHTNDAPSAVSRLRDLGVEPFLISSSVRAIMAQRLVRRVCAEFSEPVSLSDLDLSVIKSDLDAEQKHDWRAGTGCPACNGTGYRGRIGIFEIMNITPEMESLIYSRVRDGDPISKPLIHAKQIPDILCSLVEVGEETGTVPEMLNQVADDYEDELDTTISGLTSILEPFMIVFLAIVVGFIVIALLLPLIGIFEQLGT
ncbi:Flp pilus assembly complex ATPase component TadA [Opitutia bacterium ISCC 51]|nr:Flp pilus assembly complex ATPase component TadA [Opitutae bacterium ISCC 51]QXD26452.1 Flp pilus assembly complex ATPase component TadA [Opitutae bacterium ISCC 52]